MFGISPMELLIVAILAVVLVGPKRLPEVMRKMGRLFVQVRRQTSEIRQGFNDVVRDAERELELERIKEIKQQVDQLKDGTQIKDAIAEHVGFQAPDGVQSSSKKSSSREFNDSHYDENGHYVGGGEDYVDADALLAKAKEIDAQVLTGVAESKDDSNPNISKHDDSKKALESTESK